MQEVGEISTKAKWGSLKALDRLGLSKKILEMRFSRNTGFKVDPKLKNFSISEPKGKVLIPLKRKFEFSLHRACVIAQAFKTRGYQPVVPVFNEYFDPNPFVQDQRLGRKIRNSKWKFYLEKFGIEPFDISEVLEEGYEVNVPRESLLDTDYRGINVSKHAKSITRRDLKKFHLDLEKDRDRKFYLNSLKNAVFLVDFNLSLHSKKDIDAVLAHDVTHLMGLYLKTAEKSGVPAFSYGNGYRDKTLIFGGPRNKSLLHNYTDKGVIDERLDISLNKSQKERIDEIMRGRVDGSEVRQHTPHDANETIEEKEKKVFGMFTNLIWDASLDAEGGAYDDPFEWIRSTINIWREKDSELIIKTHPAEHKRGTNEKVSDWIRENCPPLPENIEILEPDTDVSPYEMIKKIDTGIVFNSTIGLEMAYRGMPVIVAGQTHYRSSGFTFDPEDTEEYLDLIGKDLEVGEKMIERAKRYCYMLFVSKHIDFPFYESKEKFSGHNALDVTYEDIASNESLDLIVNNITEGKPVIKEIVNT